MTQAGPAEAAYRDRIARALAPTHQLGELIGRGGFAEVWRAFEPALKRDVAVKVLRYDLAASEALLQRFRREAEAVAQLRHPNIVPIYGIGEGEGLVYFTMPIVRGETLAQWLEVEPLPPLDEVRRILADVADALHTAHRTGIVHRDVKPENIMLEGEDRRVLVMDFGIAKALAQDEGTLTATGMIIGTPQYMSPEQGSGERAVDHRSDIYSLGVVAYQMVTGRVPFGAGSLVAVLVRHATETPPPITDLRPDCPRDLAQIIDRCLEKASAARWQSAAELRDAIRRTRPSGERPSAAVRAEVPSTAPVLTRTRAALIGAVVLVVAAAVADALTRGLSFSPYAIATAGLIGVLVVGRLAIGGIPLHALWRGVKVAAPASESTADESEMGGFAARVRRARADRATVVAFLARMPAAERRVLQDALPELDHRLAEAAELARQAASLERALAKTVDAEDRARAEVRRTEVLTRLDTGLTQIHEIRVAVRRAATEGLGAAAERLATVLARPEA